MRLAELQPELHGTDAIGVFLYFNCPHCRSHHAIQIPIRAGEKVPNEWGWNGERDLEKITVTPSIAFHSHWHGYVTDGEIITLGDSPPFITTQE